MWKSRRSRAWPRENFTSYFLDTFDRPKRVTVCDCERSSAATLGQVLLLANSDEIESKIENGEIDFADISPRICALLERTSSLHSGWFLEGSQI